MSLSAQNKSHFCHHRFWTMASESFLLTLALAAFLTNHAVNSEINDGSGDDQLIFNDEQVSAVTASSQNSKITDTLMQTTNKTQGHNSTTEKNNKSLPDIIGDITKNQTEVSDKVNQTMTNGISGVFNGSKNRVLLPMDPQTTESAKTILLEEDEWYSFIIIIAVCLIVVLMLLTAGAVGLYIKRSRRKSNAADLMKSDPYLDEADDEKVPMPMFEEDVPSVLELEMEDFEKWIIKRGSDIGMDSKQKHI